MDNPFLEGQPGWYWYQLWLPVITSIGLLTLLIYVFTYPVSEIKGNIPKVLSALAFLGALPQTLERIGIGVDASDPAIFTLSYISLIAGVAVAYYHYNNRKQGLGVVSTSTISEAPEVAAVEDIETDDDMSATMTQITEDPNVTPGAVYIQVTKCKQHL